MLTMTQHGPPPVYNGAPSSSAPVAQNDPRYSQDPHMTSAVPPQPPAQPPALPGGLQSQRQLPLAIRQATPSAPVQNENGDTAMHDKTDDSDHKSKDSDSEHSPTGTRKRRTKRRPHKFYCTDYPPCSLSFTRSEHLSRHIRRHTGERPFRCHCGRSFTRLDNLRQHAQTVHANEAIPPDSLAAHGGRGRQTANRGKRASISQHPINGVPSIAMAGGHSRSMSTPDANYSAHMGYPAGPYGAGVPPPGAPGYTNIAPSTHQPPHGPPPPGWVPPGQVANGQYPGAPQFSRPVYGAPPPPGPPTAGPPPTGHGHNRSRSLMTPGEMTRPSSSSLRDNMNKLRQPSHSMASQSMAPNGGPGGPAGSYGNTQGPPPPLGHQGPPVYNHPPMYRGHGRVQSHSAVMGGNHSAHGYSYSGQVPHVMRTMNSGRPGLPPWSMQAEMERARSGSSGGNSGGNAGRTGNNTNSQSPVTPTDDYVQSPGASPAFSPNRDFSNREYPRERGSISSFDFGRNGDGDRLAPLPRPGSLHTSGMPHISLAPYARNGRHQRSQSWTAGPGSGLSRGPIGPGPAGGEQEQIRLPPLLLDQQGMPSQPARPAMLEQLMEPKLDL